MEKNSILDKLESFNEQLNLSYYWIIFLKYKMLILILPLFIGLLGYLIALNINPLFQSNSTIVIESQTKKLVDIEEVYNPELSSGFVHTNYINNQIEILRSDEIANRILSNKETVHKLAKLYNTIPDGWFTKNIKAIKKLIFFVQFVIVIPHILYVFYILK